MADADGAGPGAATADRGQHRYVMPALMAFQPTTNWVIRVAINTLVPYICAEQGFSEEQRAMLLAAFYPGYVGAHIPGGYMVQSFGGKLTLALNMWGSAAVCALVPLAVRLAPSKQARLSCLTGLLFALGLCQGPLIPALQTMRKDWIPSGPGRALALRLQDLGGTATGLVAPLLPPMVATRYGWKAFFGGYAVYCAAAAALWQRYARDKPRLAPAPPPPPPPPRGGGQQKHSGGGEAAAAKKGEVVDWSIFRTVGVQAMIAAQIGAGMSNYVMMQWQPIYFTEVLGASPLVAAVYFAWAEVATFTCDWSVALLETVLTSQAVLTRLQQRKLATLVGSVGQAGCMAAFVRCKTPLGAAIASYGVQGFYCCHHSGE
jgi:sugar phosphate permease